MFITFEKLHLEVSTDPTNCIINLSLTWWKSPLKMAFIVYKYIFKRYVRSIFNTKPSLFYKTDIIMDITYHNIPCCYFRKLLFIQNGTIHLFDLKTSKIVEKNILKFNRFEEVTCLTVDPQARVVYAVGFHERRQGRRVDVDGYLVSTDYYGSTFRVLLRRRDLSGAFSLTALDDQVFWAEVNQKRTKKTLYSYSVPSHNTGLGEPEKLSTLPTVRI